MPNRRAVTPGSSLFLNSDQTQHLYVDASNTSQTEYGQSQFILPTSSLRQHTAPSLSYLRRWSLKARSMTPAPSPLCFPHNWLPRNLISSIPRPFPPSPDLNFHLLLLSSPSWLLTILAATAPTTCIYTRQQVPTSSTGPISLKSMPEAKQPQGPSCTARHSSVTPVPACSICRVLHPQESGCSRFLSLFYALLSGVGGWRVVSRSFQVRIKSPEFSCSWR